MSLASQATDSPCPRQYMAGPVLRSPLSSTAISLAPLSYSLLPHAPEVILVCLLSPLALILHGFSPPFLPTAFITVQAPEGGQRESAWNRTWGHYIGDHDATLLKGGESVSSEGRPALSAF